MFARLQRQLALSKFSRAFGTPVRNRNGREVVHASQLPAADANIDFAALQDELKYKLTHDAAFPDATALQKRSGWTAPPSTLPELPFLVTRSLTSGALPVYTAYKGGRTKVVTELRRVSGDVGELVRDMEVVCDGREVQVRPGKLVVEGNYHWRLKLWLAKLGF